MGIRNTSVARWTGRWVADVRKPISCQRRVHGQLCGEANRLATFQRDLMPPNPDATGEDKIQEAQSRRDDFVKPFSKVPTFTAHHLWVSFSFAVMNVAVSRRAVFGDCTRYCLVRPGLNSSPRDTNRLGEMLTQPADFPAAHSEGQDRACSNRRYQVGRELRTKDVDSPRSTGR
jgi:hypothetical protein